MKYLKCWNKNLLFTKFFVNKQENSGQNQADRTDHDVSNSKEWIFSA